MRTLVTFSVLLALSSCSDEPSAPAAEPAPTVTVAATETVTASPPEPVSTGSASSLGLDDPEPDVVTTRFPPEVRLPEHGGHYVAVALAASEPLLIHDSVESVARHGYHAGIGELACLSGAAEAYGLPPSTIVSYLLFKTVVQAFRFTDAYAAAEDGTQMGVARVTTYCLD
jgi:hypothetical protein